MDISEYVATIGIRPAELSGLKELPASTKDRLTPVVLLAPWLATTPLSRALEKFEASYSSRSYFIDLDSYYTVNDNSNEAKAAWAGIAGNPPDLPIWWDLLSQFPNANPCLLLRGCSIESARQQIQWARENNRAFCVRLDFAKTAIPDWLQGLMAELTDEGAVDFAVMLEFGWVSDALTVAGLASGYVNGVFAVLAPEVPIIISCTSFPSDFTPYDGLDECRFTNRDLINFVRQGTNRPRIIYGDWGSTKPRSDRMASPPKYRIDYPLDSSWVISRDSGESVSFPHAALRIISSSYWTGGLGIWGEQLIEGTAAGQNFAIDSMPKMYAARINIHLHRQAFYGDLPPPSALDEEWSDDDL